MCTNFPTDILCCQLMPCDSLQSSASQPSQARSSALHVLLGAGKSIRMVSTCLCVSLAMIPVPNHILHASRAVAAKASLLDRA